MNGFFSNNSIMNKKIIGMMAVIAIFSIGITWSFYSVKHVHAIGVSDSVASSHDNSGTAAFANKDNSNVASATGKSVHCFSGAVKQFDIDGSFCMGNSP